MDNLNDTTTKIKEYLKDDKLNEAEALIRKIDSRNIVDSSIHLQLADLSEEGGLIDRLILELNLALRDSPQNPMILKRLAAVHQDSGDLEKAAKYWNQALKGNPKDSEAYEELGNILIELKEYEKARQLYQKALEITNDPLFKNLLRSIKSLEESSEDSLSPEESPLLPTDSQLVRFTSLFSGREGVYARQWVSPTGETGYTPIREPFTLSVAKNHILGNLTVGIYQLRMDNTVTFIAFDIDIPKYLISRIITDKVLWDKAMKEVQRVASKIVDAGAAYNIPVYIEDSGYKGRHCWIFLESPMPAKIAKRFATILLKKAGDVPKEIAVEVFPKQIAIKPEGLGNLIKIPLGIHRKTGKKSVFIDPKGEPYPDQLKFLEEIIKVPKKDVFSYLQRIYEELELTQQPVAVEEKEEVEPVTEEEEKPQITGEIFHVKEEYDLERDEEFQYLMLRCEVIKAIVEKINHYHELSSEERIVLVHSVGHLQNGPMAVNSLLKRCADVEESLFMKNRLKGNPISCPKIRARISEITSKVQCNCNFEPILNMYPTPFLHIQSLQQGGGKSLGQGIDSLQFQNLIQEYLKVRRQMRELEVIRDKYQKKLDEFFEQAGISFLETSLGVLKKVTTEDGSISYILEL